MSLRIPTYAGWVYQPILFLQAYSPFWISGKIRIQGQKTEIGEAGYRILDAITELYEYEEEPYTL